MDSTMVLLLCFVPVAIFIVLLFDRLTQSTDAYKDKIIEELAKNDCTLVSLKLPAMFATGPFSAVQIDLFRASAGAKTVRGDKTRYRIVQYKTGAGVIKQSWIKVEIRGNEVAEIKWVPTL